MNIILDIRDSSLLTTRNAQWVENRQKEKSGVWLILFAFLFFVTSGLCFSNKFGNQFNSDVSQKVGGAFLVMGFLGCAFGLYDCCTFTARDVRDARTQFNEGTIQFGVIRFDRLAGLYPEHVFEV